MEGVHSSTVCASTINESCYYKELYELFRKDEIEDYNIDFMLNLLKNILDNFQVFKIF